MSIENKLPDPLPESPEVCRGLMERLTADCNNVRDQIEESDALWKATGRAPNPLWYRKARSALRWLNRDRVRLQEHMSRLRKAATAQGNQDENRLLILALREHVTPEVFQACVDKARAQAGHGFCDFKSENPGEVRA
ncbi:hypothetical protein [Pseudomonas nicosulfuronedens]